MTYSIQHGLVLHGEAIITNWQKWANPYPDARPHKLLKHHLKALNLDLMMHLTRGDLLLVYQAITSVQHHLPYRYNEILTVPPEEAVNLLETLVDEMFALVEQHMPSVNLTHIHRRFYTCRQPHVIFKQS